MTFDPWAFAADARLDESQLSELQRLQVAFARDLDAHRPTTGFDVLQAVARCAGNGVPAPEWLALQLQQRLGAVTSFNVRSLDDAFGPVPQPEGDEHLNTARLRKRWAFFLKCAFTPLGQLKRTDEGYKQAAALTGGELSAKQVKTLLPKTRENEPASDRNDRGRLSGLPAHDPFALTKSQSKN